MPDYQRPVEDGSMSVSECTKLGYGLMVDGSGMGKEELSGPGPFWARAQCLLSGTVCFSKVY